MILGGKGSLNVLIIFNLNECVYTGHIISLDYGTGLYQPVMFFFMVN